jgi:hypothetical protein
MLFLRLLGTPALSDNGSALTGLATRRHRLALLALLAISRSRPQSRNRLVGGLWPERDEEHACNPAEPGRLPSCGNSCSPRLPGTGVAPLAEPMSPRVLADATTVW